MGPSVGFSNISSIADKEAYLREAIHKTQALCKSAAMRLAIGSDT